jgi:hypothetical protein
MGASRARRSGEDELSGGRLERWAAIRPAGAGAGSDARRKITMDRDGAIKLSDAAAAPRCGATSSSAAPASRTHPRGMGCSKSICVPRPKRTPPSKPARSTGRSLRPGALTDEPGTGNVRIDTAPFSGSVPRDGVAAVIARVLPDPGPTVESSTSAPGQGVSMTRCATRPGPPANGRDRY